MAKKGKKSKSTAETADSQVTASPAKEVQQSPKAAAQKSPNKKDKTKAVESPKKRKNDGASPVTKKAKASELVSEKEFGYVSKSQVAKAITELRKFVERRSSDSASGKADLFADADAGTDMEPVIIDVDFKKLYSDRAVFKPKVIELAKAYLTFNPEARTCLFIRDQFITSEAELEQIEDAKIPTLSKIVTLHQLKTIYLTQDKRQELYDEFDLFVVDDAILSSMPTVLGHDFYSKPYKFPVSIRVVSTKSPKELSIQTLTNQINKALTSTAFLPPFGTSTSMIVGALDKEFGDEALMSNVERVLNFFPSTTLRTIGLKVNGSPVLPLFYADKIYNDEDVLENVPQTNEEDDESNDVFTQGLLDLADEETVTKVLGKSLNTLRKKNKSAQPATSVSHV